VRVLRQFTYPGLTIKWLGKYYNVIITTYISPNIHNHKNEMSLLKLDVKFELPIYDGEVNAEKLENWIS
jgi:hypothetical protein